MPNHTTLIIGCGSIGERHLRCFLQTRRTAVNACDSNPATLQRIAGVYQVPVTPDWRVALASGRYDTAVVCTPASSHISIARQALEGGLHVLIEKPLAVSLDGVDDLLKVRAAVSRQVAVAYVFRQFPMLRQAGDFLRSGGVGKIRQAWMNSGQPFHLLRPTYAESYYRDQASGGGAIQDALTHSVNWIESILGPTDSVICDCAHLFLPHVTVEDTVHLAARHGDKLVSYTLNQFQAPNETTLQVNAEQGSVRIDFHQQRWGVFRYGASSWEWHEAAVTDRDAHFIAQANAFLDQVEGAAPAACTLEEAAQSLRFNLAALASARSGQRVFCKDVT